jgi:hypothetical protein
MSYYETVFNNLLGRFGVTKKQFSGNIKAKYTFS